MRLRNIPGSKEAIDTSHFVVHDSIAQKGHWKELFSSPFPLYVEIGMGKGRFLMDMAAAHTDRNFIGIEMYSSVLIRAIEKAEKRALGENAPTRAQMIQSARSELQNDGNLETPSAGSALRPVLSEKREAFIRSCNFRFLRLDARELESVFAPGEIAGIYLNFSDPWPKDRHAKRRLPGRVFLKRYEQILIPDGRVEFKTDNRLLFDFALEEAREAGWTVDAFTYDLHHDSTMNEGNILTEYEKRFSGQGNPICKLIEHPGK